MIDFFKKIFLAEDDKPKPNEILIEYKKTSICIYDCDNDFDLIYSSTNYRTYNALKRLIDEEFGDYLITEHFEGDLIDYKLKDTLMKDDYQLISESNGFAYFKSKYYEPYHIIKRVKNKEVKLNFVPNP